MEAIRAVTNTTYYISSSENNAWKKFRLVQDFNPWPCDTGAALNQLS